MFITPEGMSPLEAYQELMRFAKRRGEGALRLALHAAVPQGFRPDLLHLLRLNFVIESGADPSIEADVLLSPLCEDMGQGYFQFDSQVRSLLLENLAASYTHETVSRIRRVANFLLFYVNHAERTTPIGNDRLWKDYLEMQRWVALAYISPESAATQLAAAFNQADSSKDYAARLQLGGLVSALASPLVRYRDLLNYAVGLQALETGEIEKASRLLEDFRDEEIKLGGVVLRSPAAILKEWQARSPGVKMPETGKTKEKVADSPGFKTAPPVKLFCCYSHKDTHLLEQLYIHLAVLKRQGMIDVADDRSFEPGAVWRIEFNRHLDTVDIILVLITPDLLASDFSHGPEMKRAFERQKAGEAYVIPILLKPALWQDSPFYELEALPKDAKFVTTWKNRDAAFADITEGISRVVKRLLDRSPTERQTDNAAPTDADWNVSEFTEKLQEAVEANDIESASRLCDDLVAHLRERVDPYPKHEAKRILQLLRRKRLFQMTERVAAELIRYGQNDPQVRRQYAQSLIDQDEFDLALDELKRLDSDTSSDLSENSEVKGLIGRVYKELYVNARNPSDESSRQNLELALRYYLEPYSASPQVNLWHGINAVALLERGRRDGLRLGEMPDSKGIAHSILEVIVSNDASGKAMMWDYATAAEACIALDVADQAEKWISRYVSDPSANEFQIASTLRHLTEVWQLDNSSTIGERILPILRTKLLELRGGGVDNAEQPRAEAEQPILEQVSKDKPYESFESYKEGMERARAVARIGKDAGRGFGTGFIVRGSDLHQSFGDDPVLLTTAYVLNDDPSDDPSERSALRSSEAVVIFEASGKDVYTVEKILWTSPVRKLDTTIARLRGGEKLKDVKPFPIAQRLLDADMAQHIYIIGHPGGLELSLSLEDNFLLDHQDPLVHYRAATEGGSAGSPVFNRRWQLIAMHHKRNPEMPRLHGKEGTYEACEGIWIGAIIKALGEELSEQSSSNREPYLA